jgi:hypothetical protein
MTVTEFPPLMLSDLDLSPLIDSLLLHILYIPVCFAPELIAGRQCSMLYKGEDVRYSLLWPGEGDNPFSRNRRSVRGTEFHDKLVSSGLGSPHAYDEPLTDIYLQTNDSAAGDSIYFHCFSRFLIRHCEEHENATCHLLVGMLVTLDELEQIRLKLSAIPLCQYTRFHLHRDFSRSLT